jgi:hypothetical protein
VLADFCNFACDANYSQRLELILEHTLFHLPTRDAQHSILEATLVAHKSHRSSFVGHATTQTHVEVSGRTVGSLRLDDACRKLEHMHSCCMVNWTCDCNPSHLETKFSFELSDADHSEDALLRYSLVYPSNESTWRCANMRVRPHRDTGTDHLCAHGALCDDLETSFGGFGDRDDQRTNNGRAVSVHAVCGPPVTLDSVAAQDILPKERLILALLLSHLYLRFIGGPWWPYHQLENSVYFQEQSASNDWTEPLPYLSAPKQSTSEQTSFFADALNDEMPSLPALGKTILGILTGRALDWHQIDEAMEHYRRWGSFALEVSGVVKTLLNTKDNIFRDERGMRGNNNMRSAFETRVVKPLQWILWFSYRIDFDHILKQTISNAKSPKVTIQRLPAPRNLRPQAENKCRDSEAFCLHDDGQEESVNSKESVYLVRAVYSR